MPQSREMEQTIEHEGETRANDIRALSARILGRGQSTYTPTQAVIARANGCELFTVDGRRLIDFASGVLVTNLGHAHPVFEKRLALYTQDLPRSAYNFLTEVQIEASHRLIASAGSDRLQKVLWAASGSEGVQKAMWCALQRKPGRNIMIATRLGFHGKKGLANDVTGAQSRNPDVRWIDFPTRDPITPADVEQQLDAIWHEDEQRIALLITEPYLGAAGSFHPPQWYHPLLQAWCREREVAFIMDEVQSCFGRTGAMYAFQKYGVEPDLVVLGKGMANGVPAAAVLGRADLIDALDFGEASDTFSATPEACAAVCATLDVFEAEDIVAAAASMGVQLQAALEGLADHVPGVVAVRGEGMVFGIEFDSEEAAKDAVRRAYLGDGTRGVHFLGPLAKTVLRVSPPLILPESLLEEAIAVLRTAWR